MTNTTRLASCSLCVYSRNAARCSATAVFPVPGPPWTTSTPFCGARMIQSCSTWIVSTMSVIWPVRLAFSAASRAASPFSPLVGPSGRGAPVQQQRLVVGVLIADAEPADVARIAVLGVDPAEAQPALGRIELGNPLGVHADHDVAFGPCLRGAAGLPQRMAQPLRGPL